LDAANGSRTLRVHVLECIYLLLRGECSLPNCITTTRFAVSIVVQCPHCETKFTLQPEMAGKSMRCPNLDCRQVFTVKDPGRPTEPPAPLPPEPPPAVTKPKKAERATEKPRPAPAARREVVEAEIVEAAVVAPPKVKEVVWSEGKDVPPPAKGKGKKPVRAAAAAEDDDPTLIRRKSKKGKSRGPWILIGMCVAIVVLIGAGVFYVISIQGKTEDKLIKQAEEEYRKADYGGAQKTYDKLKTEYPNNENTPKYKFFGDLCAMQIVVRGVTNRENPDTSLEKFLKFTKDTKDSPFAKPESGYGRDILEAGKKLVEDINAHAEDRVTEYRKDRSKSGELDRAEKAIASGRDLLPVLEKYRAGDDPPLDPYRQGFDKTEKLVKHERARTAAITKAMKQLEKLSDAAIQQAEGDLSAAGFLDDDEAQALIAAAKGRLRDMVKFEAEEVPPRAAPTSATATVLFVAPVGQTRRAPQSGVGENVQPVIFLAVARGILYALDEDTGTLKWALRVGPDVTDPPTVTRVELDTGPAELALVTSNAGGEPALAGYVVETGLARWYQPLPAPAAGPATVVGGRAYVALRDPEGSIYEFDLTSGTRKGRIRLGQPAGPGMAVRPGTGLLYAAADARRVYVIDTGAKDADGNRKEPVCVQVIATNHPAGTLRTPPVLLGPDGEEPAERWMILAQTDGKLRAFQVQQIQPPPADGKLPPETPAKAAAELSLDGWVWYPPATDGERLGVVTDRGQFRLFGVNQPGNFDTALFPLHSPTLPAPPEGTAIRGLVLPAEEAAFWVFADGTMQKFRLALIPSRGLEVVPTSARMVIGEPTQAPQFTGRRDAACIVVRSLNSAGYKAIVMDISNGELRWQRQLGVMPATVPIPQDGGVVLASEDGGLVYVPTASGLLPGQTTVAPPVWVIATPPDNVSGSTVAAVSANGKFAFTLTPVSTAEDGKMLGKYVIRRIEGGRKTYETTVVSPGPLAGQPVVLGDSLLIPTADGYVHRLIPNPASPNSDTLAPGPQWLGERRADSVCYITPTSESGFLTNDGGKKLLSWEWPKTGRWSPTTGNWDLREKPAGPGVVIPPFTVGDSPRVLIADVTGSVWLYAERGGPPLKRWKPGDGLPAGEPTSPLVIQTDANGRVVVAYIVKKKFLVCIDPDHNVPKIAVQPSDDPDALIVGSPQPAGRGRWLVTDLAGRLTLVDAEGMKVATMAIGLPGVVPARAAGLVGETAALAPLSDGSAVVLTLPGSGAPAIPGMLPKQPAPEGLPIAPEPRVKE
jgi:outer membrane protein assembly factor BamB